MLSMISKIVALLFVTMVCELANGYPLSGFDTSNGGESLKVELLTRPLEDNSNIVLTLLENKASDVGFDENPDDLELAEVNVFRPVFRYRVAVSKNVKVPPRF